MRGTFANIRLKNRCSAARRAASRVHLPDGEQMSIYDAAMQYQAEKVPLVVIAGAEYGTGLVARLGGQGHQAPRRARGHRQELRAHPPLEPGRHGRAAAQFDAGRGRGRRSGSPGARRSTSPASRRTSRPARSSRCVATADGGTTKTFTVTARIDTPNEVDYYQHGGILQFVLRQPGRQRPERRLPRRSPPTSRRGRGADPLSNAERRVAAADARAGFG